MILEGIFIAAAIFGVPAAMLINSVRYPSIPFEAQKPPVLEVSTVPDSDIAAMIIALLKEDKDWTGDDNLTHATGLVIKTKFIRNYNGFNHTRVEVFVRDESGSESQANISSHDARLILGEVNGFKHRREAAKQRALATEVAKRIVALRDGTLQPILGDDGVSDTEVHSLGGPDSVPSDYIYFDPNTHRVVKVGAGTSVDRSFIERYKLGYR